ncbi:F-type conjugal transfer protein TraK [Citrobacter meridianamericanus]|uniref:F-type conjugal transfer protein TraK n=1 Tax=Citrobacter meridianamericanus TaxID=2894201 RepID=UPI00351D4FFE
MRKIKRIKALALLVSLSGLPLAPAVASAVTGSVAQPVKIPVSADVQARVSLSNTQPNMVVVPGDRIVAVDSAQGMFLNAGDYGRTGQANGGVLLMTDKTTPFTFYVRTAGGLTVSLVAHPQARDGRVIHLMSDRPVSHPQATVWERSHPYVTTLVNLQKDLMNGRVPVGYEASPVVQAPVFSLPSALSATAEAMWSGGGLRVYRYRLVNRGTSPQAVPERLFRAPGVRSVVVSPWAETLLPAATSTLWVTVSQPAGGQ